MNEPSYHGSNLLQYASRVRAAQSSDLGEIVGLIDRASSLSIDIDELEDEIRAGQLIVLDVAGEIRGVASVRIERHKGRLAFLVLDPAIEDEALEARMRGVAAALCIARGAASPAAVAYH